MPPRAKPAATTADSFFATLMILGAITLALHVAGAAWLRDQLWGTHLYAFFPAPIMVVAIAALIATAALTRARHGAAAEPARAAAGVPASAAPASARPSAASSRRAWLTPSAIGLASAALFWLLRIRHRILGDANTLSQMLPKGESFHPDSPLTEVIHQALYRAARGLFERPGRPPEDVAALTTTLGSVVAGGVFAVTAWALAREMLAARGAPDARPAHLDLRARWLLFGCLVAQGYVQLFCGYVENYTYLAAAIALYLLFALRHLDGRGALLWPGAFLILGVAFHLSAVILAPSFLVLIGLGLRRPEHRLRIALDLFVLAALFAAVALLLEKLGGGYNMLARIFQMGRTAQSGELQEGSAALFSTAHLRDFLSEQMLIGPLALLLAIAAAFAAWRGRRLGEPRVIFLLAAAGVCALVSFAVRDLRLGYGRDWDLFAPFGIAFAVFGYYAFVSAARGGRALRTSLALALAVSLFHSAPWVAINMSFDRSFERLKTLPLGGGRTESMVGYWYGRKGDFTAAHRWLQLAVDKYPNHIATYLIAGPLYMQEGRYLEAAQQFWLATRLRPGWIEYRVWLVDALVRGGQPAGAVTEAEVLVEKWPTDAQALAMYGVALHGAGRVDEARAALGGAVKIAPAVAEYRAALANLDVEGGYEKTLSEVWAVLARRGV